MNSRYTTRQATIFCIVPHANDLSTILCHYQDMNMNIKGRTCNAPSVIGHSRSKVRLKHTCIHTAPSQVSSVCTQNVGRDFSMKAISPGIPKDIMAESTSDCPYQDTDKRNYNSHRLSHSRIARYKCETCNKEFVFNTQKRRHLKEGKCPIKCSGSPTF